jgi:hypothetical protein
MLRSFQVGNHRSIRDEQELALIPGYEKNGRPVVPVAAIYGGNATGKSNLVNALQFMQEAVRSSFRLWEAERGVPRTPFRLDAGMLAEPSTFAVTFRIRDTEYVYGFGADDTKVREEWLYAYRQTNRKTVVFERAGLEVTLGDSLRERTSRRKLLTTALRDNALLLSTAMQVGGQPEFAPVYRWFAGQLRFGRSTPRPWAPGLAEQVEAARVEHALRTHPKYVELVRAADVDVADVRVEVDERPSAVDFGRFDEAIRRPAELTEAEAQVEGPASPERATHQRVRPPRRLVFMQGTNRTVMTRGEQSAGTLAYVNLLSYVLDALVDGSTLVVDEIDTSLHPRLVTRLIELFRDQSTNPHPAQLVFTTHDATLLGTSFGREILRRDEIWFTEKQGGATRLYPLTDFHPRKEDNRERRYLGGTYGGVPAVFSDTLVKSMIEARSETADATS